MFNKRAESPTGHGTAPMIPTALAAMMMLVFAGADEQRGARPAPPPPPPAFRGSISIHEEVIMRLPRASRSRSLPFADTSTQWREHRGPHCIETRRIAGATMLGPSSFDLILNDRTRIRARLESRCPALDYYRGFYVSTANDGRICADRDTVRSRAGAACGIDAFRILRPVRP
jgi:hypothetical protein